VALTLDPSLHCVYNYLAIAHEAKGEVTKAANYLLKLLEIAPNNPDTLLNLGILNGRLRNVERARNFYFRAIAPLLTKHLHTDFKNLHFTPSEANALCMYANDCLQMADWVKFNEILPLLKEITHVQLSRANTQVSMAPFTAFICLNPDPYQVEIAKRFAQFADVPTSLKFIHHTKVHPQRLRIGYISPDFNAHPVGFLINDLFSLHDREKFEIFGYYLRNVEDEYTAIIRNSVDTFRDLTTFSFAEAAKIIKADEIDILIDLAAYTEYARPTILAYKPAPIQAHYLGCPGTMGAPYIQYHISHPIAIPESSQYLYTEQLVYLPNAPFATKGFTPPSHLPTRADYNLPEDKFIFCCFAQIYRIDEATFTAWMQILKAVPNSILWLNAKGATVINNLTTLAASHGIEANRLYFHETKNLSSAWHHTLADVWLDTFKLSSGTNSYLCAWGSLPVLTFAGKYPQGRTGAAIINSSGAPELVTYSIEEYVAIGIKLGVEPNFYSHIKQKLQTTRNTSDLFNPKKFIRELEKGYTLMWQDNLNGNKNKTLYI